MPEGPHGARHDWKLRRDEVRELKIGMPGHGADGNRVAPGLNERHARNVHQIDNYRGARHPEVQQRHQGLPTGQYLAVSVCRSQRRNRRFEALWSDIVEGGWFHLLLRKACWNSDSLAGEYARFSAH